MLGNQNEYQKMYAAEGQMWWYSCLHFLVRRSILKHSRNNLSIKVLDAGCGTGGCLASLQHSGFSDLSGFDLSPDAVSLSHQRGLSQVFQGELGKVDQYFSGNQFDVVICNDVFYFIAEEERINVLARLHHIIKDGGLLIMNLPFFLAFKGHHDHAVGIQRRFEKSDIETIFNPSQFKHLDLRFWPFFLSPLIWIARVLQRLKPEQKTPQESDVHTPNLLLNIAFYCITIVEFYLLPRTFWGSSLFVTLKIKKG